MLKLNNMRSMQRCLLLGMRNHFLRRLWHNERMGNYSNRVLICSCCYWPLWAKSKCWLLDHCECISDRKNSYYLKRSCCSKRKVLFQLLAWCFHFSIQHWLSTLRHHLELESYLSWVLRLLHQVRNVPCLSNEHTYSSADSNWYFHHFTFLLWVL